MYCYSQCLSSWPQSSSSLSLCLITSSTNLRPSWSVPSLNTVDEQLNKWLQQQHYEISICSHVTASCLASSEHLKKDTDHSTIDLACSLIASLPPTPLTRLSRQEGKRREWMAYRLGMKNRTTQKLLQSAASNILNRHLNMSQLYVPAQTQLSSTCLGLVSVRGW